MDAAKITIKGDEITIVAKFDNKPGLSKSGKTHVLFTTGGFVSHTDDKGRAIGVSVNVTTPVKVS